MRLPLISAFVLAVLASPGCSAISALDEASRPLEIYELRTPDIQPIAAGRRKIEVVVEQPITSGTLATERIMIRPGPLQTQYLPGVRWSDPAPVMLQTLIVRSLTETGAFGSVGRRPVGSLEHYAVLSELTDFQAETMEGTAGAKISIRLMVRVVNEREARVIATQTFSATEDAAETDANTIVAGFNRALAQLLSGIVPWLVTHTGASS